MDMVTGSSEALPLSVSSAGGASGFSDRDSVRARTPTRLLVLSSDTYPPKRVDVCVLFAEQLGGRGHEIDWLLQSEDACSAAFTRRWHNGSAWVGPTDLGDSLLSRIRKHMLGIAHDLRVFGLIRKGDYDVVVVKDKFVSGLVALLAARLRGSRFVFWLSYPFAESYLSRARDGTSRYPFLYRVWGGFFWLALYRVLLPAADHVFVQSEQMRRDVAANGIDPNKMTAVPMGVRAAMASSPASEQPRALIPADEKCFLYVGTLTRVRRLDFLVRVLAAVRRSIPQAKLYFVGSGDDPRDEQLLREETARLGLDGAVVLVGQKTHEEAMRYVREADVCVSPFFPTPILNSTSPTKLVEYMALGRPVVGNDHPEQSLVIGESGAGYCVPWSEEAFAQAIVRLLEAPEAARSMGERGRQYVLEHRSYEAISTLVEAELLKLARAGRQR